MLAVDRAVTYDNGLRNYLRRVPQDSVLYYPGLDYGNWHTGTIKDYSGYGNDGALGTTTWVRNAQGLWVLNFDGDDYVNIDGALTDLAATTKGTWMFWIKLVDATPVATSYVLGFGDTNATELITLDLLTSGVLRLQVYDAGAVKIELRTTGAVLSDGVWGHLALIQDGTSPVLLVNGVQVAQSFNNETDKTAWFSVCTGLDNGRIGCTNFANTGNYSFVTNGQIALPKLINTNLTVAQVLGIVNQERRWVV